MHVNVIRDSTFLQMEILVYLAILLVILAQVLVLEIVQVVEAQLLYLAVNVFVKLVIIEIKLLKIVFNAIFQTVNNVQMLLLALYAKVAVDFNRMDHVLYIVVFSFSRQKTFLLS